MINDHKPTHCLAKSDSGAIFDCFASHRIYGYVSSQEQSNFATTYQLSQTKWVAL